MMNMSILTISELEKSGYVIQLQINAEIGSEIHPNRFLCRIFNRNKFG